MGRIEEGTVPVPSNPCAQNNYDAVPVLEVSHMRELAATMGEKR
jgi:hypothetical protein